MRGIVTKSYGLYIRKGEKSLDFRIVPKKDKRNDNLLSLNKNEKMQSVEQKAKIPIDEWNQERTDLEVVGIFEQNPEKVKQEILS